MPVSTGPGLKIEGRKSEHLVRVVDSSRRSTHQDTPTLAQGVINTIDLKPDNWLSLEERSFANIRADDDASTGTLEVHRQGDGSPIPVEHESAHPAGCQVRLALLRGKGLE